MRNDTKPKPLNPRPKSPLFGKPRPSGRYREQFGVIVVCADEPDQKRVYEALFRLGLKCKVVVT